MPPYGPDSKTREAGLRLDVAESAQTDLGGYVAIAAGKPDSSEAVRRMFSNDPEKSILVNRNNLISQSAEQINQNLLPDSQFV